MSSFTSNSDGAAAQQDGSWLQTLAPMLLLVSLVVVIECVAYVSQLPVEPHRAFAPSDQIPNLEESIVQAKLDFIDEDKQKVDLVVLGDSSGLMGVDATLLAKQTGLSTYNLCTIGWLGVEGHVMLLREFMAKHGVPAVVVYHFAPSTMSITEKRLEEVKDLTRLKWTLGLEEPSYLLPSLKYRTPIRNVITPDFSELPRGRWPSHAETMHRLAERAGSMSELHRDDWLSVPQVSGKLSDCQQQSVRQLVDLARRSGFRLYLIANPLPEIAKTADNLAALQRLEEALERTIEGDETVHLHQPLERFYANEMCATINHLHPDAVDKNTATIAAWVSTDE